MKGFGGSSVVRDRFGFGGGYVAAVYTVRFCGGGLRAACLPEEIEARHCHPASGSGSDSAPPCRGRALHRESRTEMSARARTPVRRKRAPAMCSRTSACPIPNGIAEGKLTLRSTVSSANAGWTQVEAGKLLQHSATHVSALMRNRSGSFSVERLMEFLVALGQDVEITVRPSRRRHGGVSLVI